MSNLCQNILTIEIKREYDIKRIFSTTVKHYAAKWFECKVSDLPKCINEVFKMLENPDNCPFFTPPSFKIVETTIDKDDPSKKRYELRVDFATKYVPFDKKWFRTLKKKICNFETSSTSIIYEYHEPGYEECGMMKYVDGQFVFETYGKDCKYCNSDEDLYTYRKDDHGSLC